MGSSKKCPATETSKPKPYLDPFRDPSAMRGPTPPKTQKPHRDPMDSQQTKNRVEQKELRGRVLTGCYVLNYVDVMSKTCDRPETRPFVLCEKRALMKKNENRKEMYKHPRPPIALTTHASDEQIGGLPAEQNLQVKDCILQHGGSTKKGGGPV